jgi:hypothetical protein
MDSIGAPTVTPRKQPKDVQHKQRRLVYWRSARIPDVRYSSTTHSQQSVKRHIFPP